MRRLVTACLYGFLLVIAASAGASEKMRCGQRIVDVGVLTVDVLRLCGEPVSRVVHPPAVGPDGHVAHGAVTVEHWVYGPEHGRYRYLRFIDGKLVEIRSRPD